MAEKKVLTVHGDNQLRSRCRKIGESYYLIGRDCFEVEGKYYKKDSKKIIFDHELKRHHLVDKAPVLAHGLVGFDADGKIITGYFSPNVYNNCIATDGLRYKHTAINPEILLENKYIENINDGVFYRREGLNAQTIMKFQTPKNQVDNRNNPYNAEESMLFATMKQRFDNYNMPMSKEVRYYGRFLGDSTFGLEVETIRGYLPEFHRNRMGLIVCRDGSLRDEDGTQGAEFVTVPMAGAKCLQNIRNICNELTKRAEINLDCSVHIHQGNLPTSRLYLSALYILGVQIQDELFKAFPYYKTDPTGVKNKNYNQKLKPMNIGIITDTSRDGYANYVQGIYNKIFTFLSEGVYPDHRFNRKNKKHPHSAKWDRHARYYWLNLMNTFFSIRNTVEYRPHPGSLNSQKIINWLFIINAISKYALENQRKIITDKSAITLKEVLNYYADHFKTDRAKFLSEYLNAYVDLRKAVFKRDYDRGDVLSNHDIINDNTYEFSHKNISHLF
jgi:hypothetical protein